MGDIARARRRVLRAALEACPIRRTLFQLLSAYRRVGQAWQRLRGVDVESEAHARLLSGAAWDEFCDALKAAGAAISGPSAPKDPLAQAEGYRYLTRLLRAGLEAFVEHNDPRAPVLRRMVHETVKMGADNPDNHYYNATISGAHRYRLSGTRGSVHLLTFSTQAGGYGEGGGLPPTGFVDSGELVLDEDGRFEIDVSVEPQPGNWLPMQPDSGLLIVRQTFADRARELPAELHLERLGDGEPPAPLSATALERGLRDSVKLVAGASLLFAKWAREFQGHENQLPRFDPARSTAAGGDPNIAYYHSYWRLAADEALVINAKVPRCLAWNFQLNNHWMESLDYRYHRIHINQRSAVYQSDGSVRVVVAHRDPGVPNWLSTAGHRYGTMCWRWVHADEHPEPRARVVPLADVARR